MADQKENTAENMPEKEAENIEKERREAEYHSCVFIDGKELNSFIFNPGKINGSVSQSKGDLRAQEDGRQQEEEAVKQSREYEYDIAISYASEQETYVRRVAKILEMEKLRIFYAPNREEEFLGRDMITEFYEIYRYQSMFVCCFVSEDYLKKDITVHEAKTALLRTKEEKRNCLIPVYFNGARLKGLDPDIHFLDGDRLREVEVADKLKLIVNNYLEGLSKSL